jgi:diacylglycerol kinase family enzyme
VKKVIGPLAYVFAGLHAILGPAAVITAARNGDKVNGALVLVGNGRLYGGQFTLFPRAQLRDGLLDVCVLPRVNWLTLARCSPQLLLRGTLPASVTELFQTESLTLTGETQTPLEVDGELIGHLPATFSVERSRLRVIVP